MKRQETVRLSCTTQMGSTRSSMRTMHPFHRPPETLSLREFGGRSSQCCFVSLLIHRAIHTSLWTSQTSADHEQGAWSATGARSSTPGGAPLYQVWWKSTQGFLRFRVNEGKIAYLDQIRWPLILDVGRISPKI